MIPRVLMQGGAGVRSALKVSLPGHDVRFAPVNGLVFDAEAMSFRILQRGFYDHTATVSNGVTTQTIGFPAQARPPFCALYFREFDPGGPGGFNAVGFTPHRTITTASVHAYLSAIIGTNSLTTQIQHTGFNHHRVNYILFVEA